MKDGKRQAPPRIRRIQTISLAMLVVCGTINYLDRGALSLQILQSGPISAFPSARWDCYSPPLPGAYLTDGSTQGTPPKTTFTEWRSVFEHRTTWGMILGFFGSVYLNWVYLTWLPGYLEIERHMSTFGTGFAAAIPFRHSGSGPAASDPAIRRGRHGYRARQDIGRHHRGRANDWLCRSSGGCAHLDRRDDRQERGRSID
jgi:hypothetical protein